MFRIIRKSVDWGGSTLVLESGQIARQADGAVLVRYGDTMVLSTVVSAKAKEVVDFLPLTVQFISKSYAVGKIPGGFLKREGKPSDRETLISRLIDRSIRPLFPAGFCDEVNVVCNLLSYDSAHSPEVASLIGVSAALAISGLPFNGPVAGVKIGYLSREDRYTLNPKADDTSVRDLELFLSGTTDSILMVESEARELPEDKILGAISFGHDHLKEILDFIQRFADEEVIKPFPFVPHDTSDIIDMIGKSYTESFLSAYLEKDKKVRVKILDSLKAEICDEMTKNMIANQQSHRVQYLSSAIKSFERSLMRRTMLDNNKRIDGRSFDQVRPVHVKVDLVPKTHGSALFTRGDTQALVITALGTPQDEQIIDGIDGDKRERFLLHYNFPPYAVGEAAALRPPGRREIGHGRLAWKAINSVLPSKLEFPYTIRVVSEITESDGSSSMATVCGASLSLMDTGIPIKSPVAGIAMGLIKEGNKVIVLSDISGSEDHLGDMDFKVAGTENGVTAMQMDMKIPGINFEIIRNSLEKARSGRLHIMSKMNEVISEPRSDVKSNAPKVESFMIDKSKIRNVIGSGGKNIREICEKTSTKIEITQDGMVMIYAVNSDSASEAKSMVLNIVVGPEIGQVFHVVVSEIAKFGVFVEFLGNKRGFIHISEIKNEHIESVDKVLSLGDKVRAIVIGIERDSVQLSMKRINQDSGEVIDDLNSFKKNSSCDENSYSGGNNFYNNKQLFGGKGGGQQRRGTSRRSTNTGSGQRRSSTADSPLRSGNGNSRFSEDDDRSRDDSMKKPRFF